MTAAMKGATIAMARRDVSEWPLTTEDRDQLMRLEFEKLADEWDTGVSAEEVLAMLRARIETDD